MRVQSLRFLTWALLAPVLLAQISTFAVATSASSDLDDSPAVNTAAAIEVPEEPVVARAVDADAAPAAGTSVIRTRSFESREVLQGAPAPWYRSAIFSLIVVLAMIAAAAWLVRRYVPSFCASNTKVIEVLARSQIAPRQSLALVQVGRRVILVGISASRMDLLSEIDEGCEVAELVAQCGGKPPGTALEFNHLLRDQSNDFALLDEAEEPEPKLTAPPTRPPVEALLRRLKALQKSA